MIDIIKLLPDSVANQIAAGEVIQRPASAVKELLENAVDAGAGQIEIVLKDSGKTLIQVIDNGSGMSVTDARMSFERHATSKIRKADDLFAIKTMGFRGEALASIAAIAQVELKTRRAEDDNGTRIVIEGSNFVSQQPVAVSKGTSFAVKNIFYNVPARRNFLKSDQSEYRHILDEFYRVSLINPQIVFKLVHNDREVMHLYAGNLKQRIVGLFGNIYNERLLAVNQLSDAVSVEGYIVKAEFSRKTRGEQYFFVNQRFIKHPYLHHAIENAFMELLPRDSFPSYFLNITVDPSEIDVNIHPTKTEVNFQNTKLIYAVIHAAVKKTIGQYNLSPRIDFDTEGSEGIDFGEISRADRPVTPPSIGFNPSYNPFSNPESRRDYSLPQSAPKPEQGNWRVLYDDNATGQVSIPMSHDNEDEKIVSGDELLSVPKRIQLQQAYILTPVKSGIMLIDQHLAHYRILYESSLKQLERNQAASQQELFPHQIQLNASDADLLNELKTELEILGFHFESVSARTFVINGVPDGLTGNPVMLIESMLENYKRNLSDLQLDKKVNLARVMAVNRAIRPGQKLSDAEMSQLIDQLFACHTPEVAPDGRKIFSIIAIGELLAKLNK
jgi:DNA mismatch repair protein MutL